MQDLILAYCSDAWITLNVIMYWGSEKGMKIAFLYKSNIGKLIRQGRNGSGLYGEKGDR
jgi:hypothetical protein